MLKQIPCYLLLFLYPCFYQCIRGQVGGGSGSVPPWFCREWQVPLIIMIIIIINSIIIRCR